MTGVEAAVEADHEGHARGLDGRDGPVDLGQVEAHRLLAQDRLAGGRGAHDEVDVGVGARADRDGVDVAAGQQGIDRERLDTELTGDPGRRLGHRVRDGDDGRPRHLPVQQTRVHPPDPTDADDPHPHGRARVRRGDAEACALARALACAHRPSPSPIDLSSWARASSSAPPAMARTSSSRSTSLRSQCSIIRPRLSRKNRSPTR